MNLLQTLTREGASISAVPSIVDIPATQPHKPGHMEYRLVISLTMPGSTEPLVCAWRDGQPWAAHRTLDVLVGAMLREHHPDHPIYRAWRASLGEVPVQLQAEVVALGKESWGEAIHTGLRKLAQTPQSALLWNALHEAPEEVSEATWAIVREAVESVLAGPNPTRRQCALQVKADLDRAFGWGGPSSTSNKAVLAFREGQSRAHPTAKSFATKVLALTLEVTDVDDVMYGMLGYVLEPVPAGK